MAWHSVDPQRFVREELVVGQKPILDGTGSYTDVEGRPDISGNTIVRSWRGSGSRSRWFLTLFTVFWNGFIVVFIKTTLHGPVTINEKPYSSLIEGYHDDPTTVFFLVFPIVGIALTYIVLAMWINRTVISMDRDMLVVRRGPIPWPPLNVEIRLGELRQLYVQAYTSHSENDRPVTAFRVMAQRAQGGDLLIEKGVDTYSDARILEQWIERKAGILDGPVPAEAIS